MATNTIYVSSNGRYIVDGSGNAVFPQNDWANQLPWMISPTDADTYLDARKAQGFNIISFQIIITSKLKTKYNKKSFCC